jgi:flagellar basal-body rod protein FlgF
MQASLYVGLSGQQALMRRLETVANNVANAGTAGFRAEEIRFESLLSASGDKGVAYASAGDTFLSRQSGPTVKTDNPLDVAVAGDAWLGLQGPVGPIYTRDGQMTMTEAGALLGTTGLPVLDAGGAPLLLDATGGAPAISRDGMVTQGGKQVGAIGLFAIEPEARLTRAGNSGVVPDIPATPVLDFNANGVLQGFSEKANVNPVMEMSQLIMIQRAFESMTATIESTEASFSEAIKTLGSSA